MRRTWKGLQEVTKNRRGRCVIVITYASLEDTKQKMTNAPVLMTTNNCTTLNKIIDLDVTKWYIIVVYNSFTNNIKL